MVEVDLRLFVTCRLCLEVQGHYQIDPSVQQQIKYCFDIDVEPFDGLPQLICKKCENILREHYATKKSFTDKQKELKTKLHDNLRNLNKSILAKEDEPDSHSDKRKINNKHSTRLDDSDSSNCRDPKNTVRKKKKVKKKRIINRLVSSSCDDSEPNNSSETQTKVTGKQDFLNENTISYDANFNKYYVCRFCSEGFTVKEDVTNHMKKHSTLQMKYKHMFEMSCSVVMQKSDNKPNMFNSNKAVVYSSDAIIQNTHNPFYYIKYYPKTYSDIPSTFKTIVNEKRSSSESTGTEIIKGKRRRLLSRSSSETVVINRHSEPEETCHITEVSNHPPTVIDCIDLGDSSDNESYDSNEKSNSSANKRKLNSKPMQDIIKMCHNKYVKQVDKNTSQNSKGRDDFLQHKVLSIGRKIINNKGFNCTGLLRFLEYKDLSVIWKETSVVNASNDGKYVRIATRVRGNKAIDTNSAPWKNFNSFKFETEETFSSINILKKLKTFGNFRKKIKVNSVITTGTEKNINSVENLPRISSVFSHTDLEITKTDADNLLLQKLLNENPVSNPKQLPKKVNSNECSQKSNDSYQKNMKVFSAPNTISVISSKQTETNNESVSNTMPIVTSTISLARLFTKEINISTEDSVNTSDNQQTYPRIKVKPVSELMPEKTNIVNSNVNGGQNAPQISHVVWPNQNVSFNNNQTWPSQANPVVILKNPQVRQNQSDSLAKQRVWHDQNTPLREKHHSNSVNTSQCSKSSDCGKEYVLLDTVEFPNTKTTSPFQYLKNLLLVHNITLMDAYQTLPAGAVCLIKLKLVYQQDKCEPITLSLSLFCFKNFFSIQIKDLSFQDIDVNNLSANWQWQLLKIYNNDVITKVLQTAGTVSSETFMYTQHFFALLKSIKIKNEMT